MVLLRMVRRVFPSEPKEMPKETSQGLPPKAGDHIVRGAVAFSSHAAAGWGADHRVGSAGLTREAGRAVDESGGLDIGSRVGQHGGGDCRGVAFGTAGAATRPVPARVICTRYISR